jgi:hypothetical protein
MIQARYLTRATDDAHEHTKGRACHSRSSELSEWGWDSSSE